MNKIIFTLAVAVLAIAVLTSDVDCRERPERGNGNIESSKESFKLERPGKPLKVSREPGIHVKSRPSRGPNPHKTNALMTTNVPATTQTIP
jgi:hypothetical protein